VRRRPKPNDVWPELDPAVIAIAGDVVEGGDDRQGVLQYFGRRYPDRRKLESS
jgi:hypothetical protein